jgi:phospholipase/carboxylesterase
VSANLSGPMLGPKEGEAKRVVVLLHGYGSDGNDLIALGSYWQPILPDALFVAPNAPHVCDINPMGYQWFPLEMDRAISRLTGGETARPVIKSFLEDVWRQTGFGPGQTILGGFSQGAMMALDVGLRLEEPLAGIVAFSGGVISPDEIGDHIKSKPPVCLIHGAEDDVVPVSMSVRGGEALKKAGVDVQVHVSPATGHSIAQDGLEVAGAFLQRLAAEG